MPATQIARESVVTADPNEAAAECAELMSENQVGCVIVTQDQEPVGIVTDRDIVLETIADGVVPPGLTASDIMTDDVVTAEADKGVFELCSKMCDAKVRRMPLVEDGELAGIVTMDDILPRLADKFEELTSVIEAESPPC